MVALLAVIVAVASGAGCGPGLEEGAPDATVDGAGVDRGPVVDAHVDGARDAWACAEYLASTYEHVTAGRAYVCGGEACAYGSDQKLGLYNIANQVVLRETAHGYFERGHCP